MANESTTNGLAGIRPAKVDPSLIPEVHDNSIAMPMVDWKDGTGAASVAIGRITSTATVNSPANGANEADAQTVSELTTSAATFSPAAKAVFVVLSLVAQYTSAPNLLEASRQYISRALATKLDTDVFALLAGFANAVGTSGVDLTLDDVLAARVLLRTGAGNRADSADVVMVLHPVQFADLKRDAMSRNSPFVDRLVTDFDKNPGVQLAANYRGSYEGAWVFESSNVPTANAGADRAGGMFIVPGSGGTGAALGGAMIFANMAGSADQSVNFALASSMHGVSLYAVGESMDVFGVEITSDA